MFIARCRLRSFLRAFLLRYGANSCGVASCGRGLRTCPPDGWAIGLSGEIGTVVGEGSWGEASFCMQCSGVMSMKVFGVSNPKVNPMDHKTAVMFVSVCGLLSGARKLKREWCRASG